MKIFSTAPADWKDLQEKVAQIFRDLGCEVGVERNIETVRGTVNIDVYAEDKSKFPAITYMCECKNWSNPVPKSVIHSFRSVVSDSGANCGYIISKAGFQSGAYIACENTNVLLLSWDEFLNLVEEEWLRCICEKIEKVGNSLRHYSDYLSSRFYDKAKEKGSEVLSEFNRLCRIYSFTSQQSLNPFNIGMNNEEVKKILEYRIENGKILFDEFDEITSYSEYCYFLISYYSEGVRRFDNLFGEKLRKWINI